jgi:hypothetical protein
MTIPPHRPSPAAILAATFVPAHADPKSDVPTFDSTKFHGAAIDNQFFPLRPGATWSYASHTPDGVETTDTEVTFQTKSILGIPATVVHDVVKFNGGLIEDTFDWYAQDEDGNVWYLGEDTKEYDGHGGFLNSTGSWEAGVLGAQAGIQMLAHPEKGVAYSQEFLAGVAEDHARVTDLAGFATVPAGAYGGLLVARMDAARAGSARVSRTRRESGSCSRREEGARRAGVGQSLRRFGDHRDRDRARGCAPATSRPVARAGRSKPREPFLVHPGQSSSSASTTVALTIRSSELPAASRIARTLVRL